MSSFTAIEVENALKTLKAGIINSLETEPMFAQILMNLKYKAASVGTCAVDGENLLFEPSFLASRTINDRAFIIAHEALHMAFLHPFQLRDMLEVDPSFDVKLANYCMDCVINRTLQRSGWNVPFDAAMDDRVSDDTTWIELYRIIHKENENQSSSSGQSGTQSESASGNQSGEQSGSRSDGESSEDSNGESSEDSDIPNGYKNHPHGGVIPASKSKELENDTKQKLSQVMQICKNAGKLSGNFARKIEEVLDIVDSPWSILQDYIEKETAANSSYRRPSRRHSESDILFPSIEKDFLIQNGVFAYDVSGSVDQKMMNFFWLHGTNIIREYSGNIFAVFCDAELPENNIHEFDCSDIAEFLPEFQGGGGTRFSPVFDWISDNDIEPEFLVYFTDMYASDLNRITPPDYPVIWMIWSDFKTDDVPFGIGIDISQERY